MPHSTRLAGDPSIAVAAIWQTVDRTYWAHRAGKPKSISPRGTLARSEALLPCWHAARQDHPPNVRLLSGSPHGHGHPVDRTASLDWRRRLGQWLPGRT